MAVIESKRQPSSLPDESCTVNKKLGFWDSKCVIIFFSELYNTYEFQKYRPRSASWSFNKDYSLGGRTVLFNDNTLAR